MYELSIYANVQSSNVESLSPLQRDSQEESRYPCERF